jgi:hypothetical protein
MVAESIKDYRRAVLRHETLSRRSPAAARDIIQLTQRPYTLSELHILLDTCTLLNRVFSRSQLYELRQIIEQSDLLQAVVDFHYYLGNGQCRAGRQADCSARFLEKMARLCSNDNQYADTNQEVWLPWRINQNPATAQTVATRTFDTPLLDLIEIAPFVPRVCDEESRDDQ